MSPLPAHTKVGPWIRLGARLLDALILILPLILITVPLPGDWRAWFPSAVRTLLTFGYFVVMEATQGGTLGKMVLNMSVRAPEGRPTFQQAATRNAFILLSLIPTVIGGLVSLAAVIAIAVTINSDPDGVGAHDRIAGAVVDRAV